MAEPQFYRIPEAAKLLAVSRSQLYVLVKTGEVPAVRLGSALRVPRVALERLIEQKLAEART